MSLSLETAWGSFSVRKGFTFYKHFAIMKLPEGAPRVIFKVYLFEKEFKLDCKLLESFTLSE